MTSASLHQFGRQALLQAWPLVTGEQPSLAELQMAGAVANLESAYGTAKFVNQGVKVDGHNNWGAVMAPHGPPCVEGESFEATDHGSNKVTPDNPSGAFQACFRAYSTPAAGAQEFIRQITIRRPNSWAAMKSGDIDQFSLHMFNEHYYGGLPVNAPASVRISNHAATVAKYVPEIAAAMNEPIAAARGGAPPAVAGTSDFLGNVAAWGGGTVLGILAVKAILRRRRSR